MAFRFKLGETIEKGFRRIGLEQIERATAQISGAEDPAKGVHELRKSMKRIRALLRLVRSGLGDTVFKAENARYRDIASGVAGARDRHVMLETLAALQGRFKLKPDDTTRLRSLIEAQIDDSGGKPADELANTEQLLVQARRSFGRLKLLPPSFEVIAAGIERGHRDARKSFKRAFQEPSDENFHEWRKSVQQHWRHMGLLQEAWPDLMRARADEARALSQILGEDHDLGVLCAFITAANSGIDRKAVREVERISRTRQEQLRLRARPLGERLFAGGARRSAEIIAIHWRVADEVRCLPDDDAAEPQGKRVKPARRERADKEA